MNNRNVLLLLLIFLGVILIYLFISRNSNSYNYNQLKLSSERISQYLDAKNKIEGKFIWETNLVTKQTFIDSFYQTDPIFRIFFWYDSVGCSRCYDFHLQKIKNNFGEENCVVIYNGEFSFLKRDFRKAKFINCFNKKQEFKQLVLLVNNEGRIIYADFPQYELLERFGESFYNISARYNYENSKEPL